MVFLILIGETVHTINKSADRNMMHIWNEFFTVLGGFIFIVNLSLKSIVYEVKSLIPPAPDKRLDHDPELYGFLSDHSIFIDSGVPL